MTQVFTKSPYFSNMFDQNHILRADRQQVIAKLIDSMSAHEASVDEKLMLIGGDKEHLLL